MGAETTVWVEVEVLMKIWRESRGVTGADALDNAKVNVGERLTGRYSYTLDDTEEDNE